MFGPGLITGASDNDPSSIVTYSQAGAKFQYATLWTTLITLPFMITLQEMCGRIGLVSKKGLVATLKENYPKSIMWLMLIFGIPAIVLNISADIAGMGAVGHLVFSSVPATYFTIGFTLLLIVSIVFLSYKKIEAILKYLCLLLFAYLIIPFFTHANVLSVLKHTFIPTLKWNKDFISILTAVLGSTISPYVFFWQASLEVEDSKQKNKLDTKTSKKEVKELRYDVSAGMILANLVMYFIILSAANVLFKENIHDINTVEQAAQALKPLLGNFAYLLFALGIIATGFLSIPALCGSVSYMLADAFSLKQGLNEKVNRAPKFYIIIIVALIIGLVLNYVGISPVQALIYTAILYGVTSPVLIAIVLHIGNNKKIMGKHANKTLSNVLGIIALLVMTAASVLSIYLQFKG